ncbi:MAG: zf-TFIIB domain-containing protein [Gemmatimonadaceae bacterium]
MDEQKPSRNEDEYFVRRDAELIKAQRASLDADRAAAERRSHFMKCPKCGGGLVETDFHHIKIDKCRDCNGIWLDQGEIEMLAHVDQSEIRGLLRSMFGLKW